MHSALFGNSWIPEAKGMNSLELGKLEIPKPGDKVLWIRFGAFGDALEAAVDACNFKKRFPAIHLTFLSHPEYTEFFRAQPYIDDVLAGYKKPFAKWRQTVQKIGDGNYQWLVNTHKGGRASLLSLFSKAEHRIGTASLFFLNYIYKTSLDCWSRLCDVDMHDRSCPSIFASEEDRESALVLLADLPEPRLFAAIGAGKIRKMWATDRWVEFMRPLVNEGWGDVLNGHGPVEEAIGRTIENALASKNVLNLVGALNFRKMSGVALSCTLSIGNDTGPLHLAALGGVPTMGLFSNPKYSKDSALELLNIPWFRVLRADDHVCKRKSNLPLENLPTEPVANAFDAFAAEFLPKAFAWREMGTRNTQ